MVICFVEIVPRLETRRAVLEILQSVIELTQGRPGCLRCACYERQNSERSVLYMEHWASQEDLDRHVQSSVFNRILNAMDLAGAAPKIVFHEVSNSRGMELVEALRIGGSSVAGISTEGMRSHS